MITKQEIERTVIDWLKTYEDLSDIPFYNTLDTTEIKPVCIIVNGENIAPTDGFAVADSREKQMQITVSLMFDFYNENGKVYKENLIRTLGETLTDVSDYLDFVNDDETIEFYVYALILEDETDETDGTNYLYNFQMNLIARW